MPELWRKMDEKFDQQMLGLLQTEMEYRRTKGREEYGDTFQGEPHQHMWEEIQDLVVYWMVEDRRRSHKEHLIKLEMAAEIVLAPNCESI